ncbi:MULTISPECIES: transposase [unclassified Wolbachia]|uniref:transposase n=1 Tax=unclassified Wolbachia TaxID=2640676 RepID=UPI0022203406|nr:MULTISPECIES: transposase [unclassified Wolbachia]
MSQKMRVSNCHEYNKFLQERGNIFHFINEAIENWYEKGPKMAGGNYIYSDKVVILVHIVANLFRIGLRQTVGFIEGYLQQIGKNLQLFTSFKKNSILRSVTVELTKMIRKVLKLP